MKPAEDLKHVMFYTHVQTFDTPWFRSEPGRYRAMKSECVIDSSPFRTSQHQTPIGNTAEELARETTRVDHEGIGSIEGLAQSLIATRVFPVKL